MKAGKLAHRVTIQEKRDQFGADFNDIRDTWQNVATVWAEVLCNSGSESVSADQTQGALSFTVTIRGGTTVTPRNRLIWGTRQLQITAVVDPDGRGVMQQLACVELVEV